MKARKKKSFLSEGLNEDKIKDIISFLIPFEIESKRLEAEKRPTLLLAVITYSKLKKHLQYKEDDTIMVRHLKTRLLRGLEEKLKPRLTLTHRVATFFGLLTNL